MNETWTTNDQRILNYFDKKENGFPFSSVKLDRGYFQAVGEWDGLVFRSKKIKRRLLKKLLRKNRTVKK